MSKIEELLVSEENMDATPGPCQDGPHTEQPAGSAKGKRRKKDPPKQDGNGRSNGGAETISARDVALNAIARGWAPVPVSHQTKKPWLPNWPQLRITAETVGAYFDKQRPCNCGVILGSPSGGLTDVDLDVPATIDCAPYFLLPTPAVYGRKSKRKSHWLYITALCKTATSAVIKERDPHPSRVKDEGRSRSCGRDGSTARTNIRARNPSSLAAFMRAAS